MQYFVRLSDGFIVETIFGELSSEVNESDYVEIHEDEIEKVNLYRKFNPETREFSEPIEQSEVEVTETEHEKLTRETYETTSTSADDNLLNMDLLTTIDDKLNLIMEHLGLC